MPSLISEDPATGARRRPGRAARPHDVASATGASRLSIDLSDGQALTGYEAGSGPDAVLIHGTLVTSEEMGASLLGPFARRFRTVAFDRPGHGVSTRPTGQGALSQQARFVREGIDKLGLRRPVLVGHSIGGSLALQLALDAPERYAGVVVIGPLVFPEPRLEPVLFGPRALARLGTRLGGSRGFMGGPGLDAASLPLLWRAIFLPQHAPAEFSRLMDFEAVGSDAGIASVGEDSLAIWSDLTLNLFRYRKLTCPVEIVCGEMDIVVNPALHGRALSRLAPRASFTSVPGVGHMVHHFEPGLILEKALRVSAAPA